MVLGSAKEGVLELFDGHLWALWARIMVGQLGAHLEPKAWGSLESFRKEDPIVSSCHLGSEGSSHHVLRLVRLA